MPYDRFMIAPFTEQSGLRQDLRAWQIPDQAFAFMENAYVFRGRVRKRFGSQLTGLGATSSLFAPLFSRLSIQIGLTTGGNLTTMVPGTIIPGRIGQQFSLSVGLETVNIMTPPAVGTPVTLLQTSTVPGNFFTTATYNTTTGVVTLLGGPGAASPVFYYPGLPVMGIFIYQNGTIAGINNEPTIAFDTQFMYIYTGFFWIQVANSPLFHGSNNQFFWCTNWHGDPGVVLFFITNFNYTLGVPAVTDDPMYYWDGTNFFNFSALTTFDVAGDFVASARIILPFHNSLLLLYTIERDVAGPTNVAFAQRCRFSAPSDSPINPDSWLQFGETGWIGGGFIDASTDEVIVTAEFIKDRLIVYFERSTWEILFTGNSADLFRWQKLNTELGSESTFSVVPFDKEILAIGATGIHACNGSNVARIDNNIPDTIFQISNNNMAFQRVHGIRDYYAECVYWCYNTSNENPIFTYPNKVLVYNYRNETWAQNDDAITAFGYWNGQVGLVWNQAFFSWESNQYDWYSGVIQPHFQEVLAGNQEGYLFSIEIDSSRNAPVLQLTNIAVTVVGFVDLTIVDHTIAVGEYVLIENVVGATLTGIFPVVTVVTTNIIRVGPATFTGVYKGGGTVTRVSNYNIQSKQWNPYVDTDRNVYLQRIDFGVERTSAGQVTVDYYPSATQLSMLMAGQNTGSIMGSGVLETAPYTMTDGTILYPLEMEQERLWHPVYFQTDGQCIQIIIYMSPPQITNTAIALSDFQIDGMVLYTMPTTARLQ